MVDNFNEVLQIGLVSPETIHRWSYGEVREAKTFDFSTMQRERNGLFCETIFGPTKDWECRCGKFKKIRYKGRICDRCGVEITKSSVRKERMGHIDLAAPVAHIWYLDSIPSFIDTFLGITTHDLKRVLYYQNYIVINPGESNLNKYDLLTDTDYIINSEKYGEDFYADIGAEAIKQLLKEVDCEKLAQELRRKLDDEPGCKRVLIQNRLEIVEGFIRYGNKPNWMIIDALPVIPPDLRPLGNKYKYECDLNNLYRQVININNRLKQLIRMNATDVVIHQQKCMLQQAVDKLINNGRPSARDYVVEKVQDIISQGDVSGPDVDSLCNQLANLKERVIAGKLITDANNVQTDLDDYEKLYNGEDSDDSSDAMYVDLTALKRLNGLIDLDDDDEDLSEDRVIQERSKPEFWIEGLDNLSEGEDFTEF